MQAITQDDVERGMREEREHYDVTRGDKAVEEKIALAHLRERYDYYDGLEVMSAAPVGYWRGQDAEGYWARRAVAYYVVMILLLALVTRVVTTWHTGGWEIPHLAAAGGLAYVLWTWK